MADPLPAAVGRAVLDRVVAEGLAGRAERGRAPAARWADELQARHEQIGDVRGAGLMLGVDLVRDRESRAPDADYGTAVTQRCLELGLNVNIVKFPALGSILRIAPPLRSPRTTSTSDWRSSTRAHRRGQDMPAAGGRHAVTR